MNLYDNIEPNCCCLCGKPRQRRGICLKCRKEWQNEDGTMPPWLRALANQAQKITKRHNRNAGRLRRTADGQTRKHATPADLGVTFVSWELLHGGQG